MENESFDKLKRDFIVDQEEYSKKKVSYLISKILPYCKVSQDGQVIVMKKLSTRKILKLILSARFIANAADKKINAAISREELKAYSGLKDLVFNSRLNDAVRDNFASKENDHVKARNILLVEQFLETMDGIQDE